MALFRKDDDHNDDQAFDLRLREEALDRRDREITEREQAINRREADMIVRQNELETKSNELKRQGEILVRLKKLIDQRVSDGGISAGTFEQLQRQAEGSDRPPSSTPVPKPTSAPPSETSSPTLADHPAPEPVRSSPPEAPQPPPVRSPAFTPPNQPSPEPASQPAAAAKPLSAKADSSVAQKVEQAEKVGADKPKQTVAEKLAALKKKVAQVTKQGDQPAAEAKPQPAAEPEPKPPSSAGSIFTARENPGTDRATEVTSDDNTKVHDVDKTQGPELTFSENASDASIFDAPGGRSTIMEPEQIHDQIDAELSRTQSQSRLDMHLRGLNEQAPELNLNDGPTSEMSVLMADRQRIFRLACRSEDAIVSEGV